MFVRPPLEFVTSMSQTRVRHGQGYHVFKVGKSSKIEMSLRVWPNLLTIAFNDAIKHPFGPFGALLEAFQLPTADRFNLIKSNESMSEYATRIIGHINTKLPLFVDGQVNPQRTYLDTEPLASIKGPKFKLTRAEFMTIRDFIQRENAALSALLGPEYCDPSFSFQDAPIPGPRWRLFSLALRCNRLRRPCRIASAAISALRPRSAPLNGSLRTRFLPDRQPGDCQTLPKIEKA